MPSTITDRLNGLTTSVAVKAPCRVATTANITLSAVQTIDGIAVVADDRVLVKNQTNATENGIWKVASGAWTRAADFDGSLDVVTGTMALVNLGTAGGGTFWRVLTAGVVVIGTTSLAFGPAPITSDDNLAPENFGATGMAADDQNTAMETMMVAARLLGKATLSFTRGSTYTVTNPFLFGGCRELVIEGNGAKLQSYRTGDPAALGVFAVNFQPFQSPIPFHPNGVEVQTYGADQGPGVNDFGRTINTVAAGSPTVTAATSIPVGLALVYGWDRIGLSGIPPTATYFEWVDVKTAGTTATLRQPLVYAYDQTAPEKTTGAEIHAGAGRIISLNRSAGAFRPYAEMDKLTVRNLTFITNAGQNAAGNATYNGVPGFGGAQQVYLENILAEGATVYINCGRFFHLKSVKCKQLEIDKMIETVVLEDCDIDDLVGGTGARVIIVRRGVVHKTNALCPLDLLRIEDGARFCGVDALSPAALLGSYVHGSARIEVENATFVANAATINRLIEPAFLTATPTITSTTVMTLTRAAYDTSQWCKSIRIGAKLYAGNVPVAEITRMPYCLGSLTVGDVSIGYKLLGGSIAAATPLYLWVLPDVEIGKIWIEGAYARQVSHILGNDIQAAGVKVGKFRTPAIREERIVIDQTLTEFAQAGNIYDYSLGGGFQVTQIEFQVSRVAVDAGAVTGVLQAISVANATLNLVGTLDMKTVGRRVLGTGGLTGGVGADAIGAGAFPTAGIVAIRFTDGSRALAEGSRAGWRCIVTGYWL